MRLLTFRELILQRVLNVILFYLGWVYIVLSAAHGRSTQGIIGAVCIIIFNIIISKSWVKELLLTILICMIGLIVDSIFSSTKMLSYASPNPFSTLVAPLWIVALYGIFATTINHSLYWVKHQPIICMIVGAIGGTLSYFIGGQMHAISFLLPEPVALSIIAAIWLVLLPITCVLSNLLDKTLGGR
ncbi:MAG: DUF2878 domain-containing protein [Chlamydiales bacterium]|nr:DUF2878 domain-containing protein [Chlamydiales bacterium]